MPKVKVNITIDSELLEIITKFASDNYLSRSTLITIACTQYLNQFPIFENDSESI